MIWIVKIYTDDKIMAIENINNVLTVDAMLALY